MKVLTRAEAQSLARKLAKQTGKRYIVYRKRKRRRAYGVVTVERAEDWQLGNSVDCVG